MPRRFALLFNYSEGLETILSKGMEMVGERYEDKEYFLTELLGAGEIMKEAMEVLRPYLEQERWRPINLPTRA